MSYPRDLDEIPRLELQDEIRRRERANRDGVCDYCGKPTVWAPCKFPKRHAVKNEVQYLRLKLEQLEAE